MLKLHFIKLFKVKDIISCWTDTLNEALMQDWESFHLLLLMKVMTYCLFLWWSSSSMWVWYHHYEMISVNFDPKLRTSLNLFNAPKNSTIFRNPLSDKIIHLTEQPNINIKYRSSNDFQNPLHSLVNTICLVSSSGRCLSLHLSLPANHSRWLQHYFFKSQQL